METLLQLVNQQGVTLKDIAEKLRSMDPKTAKVPAKARPKILNMLKDEIGNNPENELIFVVLRQLSGIDKFIDEMARDSFLIASICDQLLVVSTNKTKNVLLRTACITSVDIALGKSSKLKLQLSPSIYEYVANNFKNGEDDRVILCKSIKLLLTEISHDQDSRSMLANRFIDDDYKSIMNYAYNTFDPTGQAYSAEFLYRMIPKIAERKSSDEMEQLLGVFAKLQQVSTSDFTNGIHNFLKSSINDEVRNIYSFKVTNLSIGGSSLSDTHWIYIGDEKIVFWMSKNAVWEPKSSKKCDILILKNSDIRGISLQEGFWCIVLDDHFDTLVECFTDENKLLYFIPNEKNVSELLKIAQSRYGIVDESSIIVNPPKKQPKSKNSKPKQVPETPKPVIPEKKPKNSKDTPKTPRPKFKSAKTPTPSLSSLKHQTGTSIIEDSSDDSDVPIRRKLAKIPKFQCSSDTSEEEPEKYKKPEPKTTPKLQFNIDTQVKRVKAVEEEIEEKKKLISPKISKARREDEINTARKLREEEKKRKEDAKRRKDEEARQKREEEKKKKEEEKKKKQEEKKAKKLKKEEEARQRKEEEEKRLAKEKKEQEKKKIKEKPIELSFSEDESLESDDDDPIESVSSDAPNISQSFPEPVNEEFTPVVEIKEKQQIQQQPEQPKELDEAPRMEVKKRTYAPQTWELEAFEQLKNFGQSIRSKLSESHNDVNQAIQRATDRAIEDVTKYTNECEENLEQMRASFDDASSAAFNDIVNKQKMVKELGQQQSEHIEQMRKDCAMLKKRAAEMLKRFEQQKNQLLQNQEKHIALFREDLLSEVSSAVSQRRREFSKKKVQKLVNLLEEL